MGLYSIQLIKFTIISSSRSPSIHLELCHFANMYIRLFLFPSNLNKKLSMERKNFDCVFEKYCTDNGFKLSKKRPDNPSKRIVELLSDFPKKSKVEPIHDAPPVILPPQPQLLSLPVKSFQDYALESKDEKDVIFIRRLEETGKLADSYIREVPSMKDVLSYIAKLPTQPPWYKTSQDSIINSKTLKFPLIDVLTRDYIRDFLRLPTKNELPCTNHNCESVRLGNVRIRALTVGDSTWCYLCHLYYTNKLYFESLNRKKDTSRVFQIHYFMVQVNVEGEYRLDMTLMGDTDVRGLFGPFPLYNCYNYTFNGKEWIESDVMVFRLSQTML